MRKFYNYNQPMDNLTFYSILSSYIKNDFTKIEKFLNKHEKEEFLLDLPISTSYEMKNPGYYLGLYLKNPYSKPEDRVLKKELFDFLFKKVNFASFVDGAIRAINDNDDFEVLNLVINNKEHKLTLQETTHILRRIQKYDPEGIKKERFNKVKNIVLEFFLNGNPNPDTKFLLYGEFFPEKMDEKIIEEIKEEPKKIELTEEEKRKFNSIFWGLLAKRKYTQADAILDKVDVNLLSGNYQEHYLHTFIFKNSKQENEALEKLNNILDYFIERPNVNFNPNLKNKQGESFIHKCFNINCFSPLFFETFINKLSKLNGFNIDSHNNSHHSPLRVLLNNYNVTIKHACKQKEYPFDKILEILWDNNADFDARPSKSKRGLSPIDVIKKLSKVHPEVQVFYEKIMFSDSFMPKPKNLKVKI